MWIEEIILDGFKSYATRTVISGFDPFFNAVTGLNGSGKSNILDAICFVLGITNLSQELVYKHGQAGVTKATVTIVFNNQDKSQSPVGYEQYDQITVTRQVVIGGRNKYLINGHNAQVNRVQNLFHSVQLNVNNPHFLIMQGRITKVLNMKPPEILAMIEEAAGTRMYEVKKENALKTIEKKEKKVEEINRILKDEITPTLEKLRGERTHYIQYTTNQQELEKLSRFATAHDYFRAQETLQKSQSGVDALVAELEALKDSAAKTGERVVQLKDEIAALTKQKEKKMGEEYRNLEKQVDQLSKDVVKFTQSLTHLQESLEAERAQKAALLKSSAEVKGAIPAKKKELEKQKQLTEALEAETKKLQASLAELQAGSAVGLAADGEGVKTFTDKLMEAKREAANAASEIKAAQMKIKHLTGELADARKAAKAVGKEQGDMQARFDEHTASLKELAASMQKVKADDKVEADLLSRKAAAERAVQELREKVDALQAKLPEFDFDFADPERGFDRSRVKGLVAKLIRVNDPAYTTAIEVAAGGKLYNVIVDSEVTGKQLLEKGRLKKRVTIIPLNKIAAKGLPERVVDRAEEVAGRGKCSVALSLVGYDDELEAAMSFVFGSTLVCKDSEAAKAVTFHKDVHARSVTLEGDVFDPSGTLTGGSRPSTSALKRLQELNEAHDELVAKEQALAEVMQRLSSLQGELAKYKALRQQADLKGHELQLLESRMKQSSAGQALARVKETESKLEEATAQLEELKKKEKTASDKCAETEEKMRTFEAQRGQVMKDAESQIAALKTKLAAATKKMKPQQQETEKLSLELEALQTELKGLEEQAAGFDQSIERMAGEVAKAEEALALKTKEYEAAKGALDEKRSKLVATDRTIGELARERDRLTKELEDADIDLKKREHKISRFHKEQETSRAIVQKLERQYPWIANEKATFNKPGGNFDFRTQDPQKVAERLQRVQEEQNKLAKSINKKVMSMFEKAEAEYQNLIDKKRIIENDKQKLIAVIDELDQKKNEALTKTYEKVNKDFGSIFTTLLPGTKAKLEAVDKSILAGLEVHVAFGGTWKESLTELSGGQKSLLALSLILALLLFKPAPMYILDEIDAALDLSHTQNIGQMLRTHFAKSQFIIVSLKEGMFNNANVLFKTKFVDGVSTVSRTVPQQAAGKQKEKEKNPRVA